MVLFYFAMLFCHATTLLYFTKWASRLQVSLTIGEQTEGAVSVAGVPLWSQAFSGNIISHNLASLTLSCALEAWLVKALQNSTPRYVLSCERATVGRAVQTVG